MILNRSGAQLFYGGVTYTVGDKIVGSEASEYEGLYGTITEIRDGEDKETENDTPDIYCRFIPPVLPDAVKHLEEVFTELYQQPKTVDDIILDMVILAPEMIRVLGNFWTSPKADLYLVRMHCAYRGDVSEETEITTSYDMAQYHFHDALSDASEDYIQEWKDEGKLQVEIGKDSYDCWVRDEYFENHFKLYIQKVGIELTDSFITTVGKHYIASQFRKQFAEQIECWEEIADLTPAQMAKLFALPEVPDRIRKQLEGNGYLIESYWESVSEAAFSLVKDFLEKLDEADGGAAS